MLDGSDGVGRGRCAYVAASRSTTKSRSAASPRSIAWRRRVAALPDPPPTSSAAAGGAELSVRRFAPQAATRRARLNTEQQPRPSHTEGMPEPADSAEVVRYANGNVKHKGAHLDGE